MIKETKEYNERLFSGGIRGFFHEARFKWLYNEMKRLNVEGGSVIELGCFDGKTINYLPFKPACYAGYDANWEGGLDAGIKIWKNEPSYQFKFCDNPALFNPEKEVFDICIAMETLEHLYLSQLEEFLQRIASSTKSYSFFTVPNEQGLLFFLKYLVKATALKVDEPYKPLELLYALLGKQENVKRNEGGHKGFAYQRLIRQLQKYFDIVSVKGIPFQHMPLSCNFTIGIIAKKL